MSENHAVQLDASRRPRLVISLTPLIDVVFILLLFFMLTTQFGRKQAMTIDVPATGGVASSTEEESLLVSLSANGTVTAADEQPVEIQALSRSEAIDRAREAQATLIVVADDDVELQTFTRLMDRLSSLGVASISVRGLR